MNSTQSAPLTERWTEDLRALPASAGPDWLGRIRERAARDFADSGLPNRKTEAWKYTPLRKLEQLAPGLVPGAEAEASFPEPLCGTDTTVVDIAGGRLIGALPDGPGGLTVLPLDQGIARYEAPVRRILESAETAGPANAFAALNNAFLDQGLVVVVDRNTRGGTLLLRWTFSAADSPRMANFRLVIVLGEGASLDLVEQFESAAQVPGALNIVTQADLAEGASLSHVRVQNESDDAVLLTATSVEQGADSRYRYAGFDLGGGLVRHGLHSRLAGPGAEAVFEGAFVLDRRRHADNHVSVDHAAPGCRSEQFFRGVLGGSSRGVFNGRALIRAGADGSSVRQSNANLLLSGLAEMDTKPELEIYADEIEASHGATVGQLDDAAIFYLRSRGLDEEQARRMLTTAFCHAVTDRLPGRDLAGRIAAMIDTAMQDMTTGPE